MNINKSKLLLLLFSANVWDSLILLWVNKKPASAVLVFPAFCLPIMSRFFNVVVWGKKRSSSGKIPEKSSQSSTVLNYLGEHPKIRFLVAYLIASDVKTP